MCPRSSVASTDRILMKKLVTFTALLLAAALNVKARQAPQGAPPAETPQATTPGLASSVAGTAKTPGNIWLPAKKAGATSPALTPDEELKTFSLPPATTRSWSLPSR